MERFNSTSQIENKFENGSYSLNEPISYVETFSTYDSPKSNNSTFVNGKHYEYGSLLISIFKDEKKVNHILQIKHRWSELLPDLDKMKIKEVIKDVIEYGKDSPYKNGGVKSKQITRKEITREVQVSYKIENETFYFSNAWVMIQNSY